MSVTNSNNVFNGTTFVNIARKGLSVFNKRLLGLDIFTRDFSGDIIQGTQVTTRVVPASQIPVDKFSSPGVQVPYNDSTILENITTTPVTVTLDQQKVCGFAITDEEAMKISSGVLQDTKDRIIEKKVNGLADQMLGYVFNQITAANFGSAIATVPAAAWDRDQVVDLRTALVKQDFPIDQTALILNPDYMGALSKDLKIAAQYSSGLTVMVDGSSAIYRLEGMTLHEAIALSRATVATSEKLVGFASTPDALAIAMRGLKVEQPAVPTEFVEVLSDEQTGATLTAYAFRDSTYRRWVFTFEAWYGASKANGAALQRIVAA